MTKLLPAILIILVLAGCNGEPEADPAKTAPGEEATPSDRHALAGSDQEPRHQAASGPLERESSGQSLRERHSEMDEDRRAASREELRERMRERRAAMGVDADTETRQARLRERQLAGSTIWWQDPAVSEQLGLSEDQKERIALAHQEHQASLDENRIALAEAQRNLLEALQGGERARIERLLVERQSALIALSEAELSWHRQLLASLSDEQLRELASHDPQALIGRQRPM